MGTGRLEAFSDGVFAVAITLLVLDLHVDADSPRGLATQLAGEWPSFAAYALSFFVIGVIWVNHHAVLALAAHIDRSFMFQNLVLLLWVATIPFTTATLAAYLRSGDADTRVAVLLYGLSNEGMGVSFTLMLAHLVRRGLLKHPVGAREARQGIARFGLGTVLYPLAVVIGVFSPVAMLIFYAAVNGFYVLEQTPILPGQSPPSGGIPEETDRSVSPVPVPAAPAAVLRPSRRSDPS
ncbi:TMEM175 family protein [Blastococcus sp. CT_GayMR16]|uniref:TMEM175 family protein n=1 Tax=Blastococcus sp. CT_GayMR16 TaxID=2559607 RepID=UPI0010735DC7|nr:TMEM175 family protein [Blastococcus sp. CT_GayMR16]TFV87168.1 DUF1211 domain-containing protein [Blastococcus sp. CT_GayMR16]